MNLIRLQSRDFNFDDSKTTEWADKFTEVDFENVKSVNC